MRKRFRFSGFRARFPGRAAILLVLSVSISAIACTIPVFRFALDRWEADPYRLVVPIAQATRPDLLKLLVPLRGNGEANVTVVESDDASLAEASLLFPHEEETIWQGALNRETLAPLLTSPGRTELLQRLLRGDSVVWVVFTTEADRAEVQRITKRLAFLEQVASLPVQNPNDPDSQLGPGPPLQLAFSVLPVSLDDPAERFFAKMAVGPANANFVEDGISFAAPIFGRGRVLGAWALAELDDTMIEDASLFLTGRCSCRVKNENPGWDIVLKVDWERALLSADDTGPNAHAVETTSAAAVEEATTETLETKSSAPELVVAKPASVAEAKSSSAVNLLTGAAIALCLIGGCVLWFRR